jgi:hypothetical protein
VVSNPPPRLVPRVPRPRPRRPRVVAPRPCPPRFRRSPPCRRLRVRVRRRPRRTIALRKVSFVPPHLSNIFVVWFVFVATALVLVGWSPLVSVGSALYGLVAAAGGIYVVGFVFFLIVFGGEKNINLFVTGALVALSVLLLPFLLLLGWSGSLWFVIAAIVVFSVTIWMK